MQSQGPPAQPPRAGGSSSTLVEWCSAVFVVGQAECSGSPPGARQLELARCRTRRHPMARRRLQWQWEREQRRREQRQQQASSPPSQPAEEWCALLDEQFGAQQQAEVEQQEQQREQEQGREQQQQQELDGQDAPNSPREPAADTVLSGLSAAAGTPTAACRHPVCAGCGMTTAEVAAAGLRMHSCRGCRSRGFCSVACHERSWARAGGHRAECKALREARAARAPESCHPAGGDKSQR